jgi:DNA-directed RNA polymerase specialized sigma24 family protein
MTAPNRRSSTERLHWIDTLLPNSLGNFEMTAEIDHDLTRRALAARDDLTERDALFTLLAAKTARFAARFSRWSLRPWEYDDVLQECWLAFDDLLRTWQPLDSSHGPAGFGYYYLRVFPNRLYDRTTTMLYERRGTPLTLPWDPRLNDRPDPDNVLSEVVSAALLTDLCGRLNAVDSTLLLRKIDSYRETQQVAAAAGISRRTFYRRWSHIVSIARELLREAG